MRHDPSSAGVGRPADSSNTRATAFLKFEPSVRVLPVRPNGLPSSALRRRASRVPGVKPLLRAGGTASGLLISGNTSRVVLQLRADAAHWGPARERKTREMRRRCVSGRTCRHDGRRTAREEGGQPLANRTSLSDGFCNDGRQTIGIEKNHQDQSKIRDGNAE